jgi:arabinose-5-phosphate isomerase
MGAGVKGGAGKKSGSAAESARRVLRIEAAAISDLIARVDERFERAVDILFACSGRIVVTGMGKSGLIGRKIAATLASTGSPALFLHSAEALHGDMGMVGPADVVVAISYSGETEEIVALLETLKRLGVKLISLTAAEQSTLGRVSDIVLDISVKEEACSLNLAPTASTTAALAMGDALAIALLERRQFGEEDFAALHPAGYLGKKLRRVEQLMHSGDDIPMVRPTDAVPEIIYEMSRKGLGMAVVADDGGGVLGIITDGDLRRLMQQRKKDALDLKAAECMTRNPAMLPRGELASSALRIMQERRITSIVVVDEVGKLAGVVHLHDLWTLQLF